MSVIQDLISTFESIGKTMGTDPSTFISGLDNPEFIKNCLINQLKRNAGLAESTIGMTLEEIEEYNDKMKDIEEQATAMIEDPDSGEKLVEDMKSKIKDSASGATDAFNNIKNMPSKVASLVSEGVSNLSSISANPLTLNCLPSATLSFIQSLNSIKTELTTTISSAVNNLKQLDDLGVGDAISASTSGLKEAIGEITDSISKGISSCPSGISFDYGYTDNTHNIIAYSNVIKEYSNLPLYPTIYNTSSLSNSKFDSSDSYRHTTDHIKILCIYYNTDYIDTEESTFIKSGNYGVVKVNDTSSDIVVTNTSNLAANILRMYVDRTTSEISTKILGITIELNDLYLAGYAYSADKYKLNFILKSSDDDTQYQDRYYDIYYIYMYYTSSNNFRKLLILPKSDYQLSDEDNKLSSIIGKTLRLYVSNKYTGINLIYNGNFITIDSSNMKLLTFSGKSSEFSVSGIQTFTRNSSGSVFTSSIIYTISNNFITNFDDLNKLSDNIVLFRKDGSIVSNEINKTNLSLQETYQISTGVFDPLILSANNTITNCNTSNIDNGSFTYKIGQCIQDEDTCYYNNYKIDVKLSYSNFVTGIGKDLELYYLKNNYVNDILTVNYNIVTYTYTTTTTDSDGDKHTVTYTGYKWKYANSHNSNKYINYFSSNSDGQKISFNIGSNNKQLNIGNISYTIDNFDVKCSGRWEYYYEVGHTKDSSITDYTKVYDESTTYAQSNYSKYKSSYYTLMYNVMIYPIITTIYLEYLGDDITKVNNYIYKNDVKTSIRIYYDSDTNSLKLSN